MTPREMILDLWESNGQRTDLEPFGDTPTGYDTADIVDCYGTRYWLRQISSAERVLTSYNKFGFKPLRFKDLIKDSFAKLTPTTIVDYNRNLDEAPIIASLDSEDYAGNVLHFDGEYIVEGVMGSFNLNVVTVPSFGLDDPQELVGTTAEIGGEDYTIASVSAGANYTITFSGDVSGVSLGETVYVIFNFAEVNVFILSVTDDGTTSTFVLKDELDGFLPSTFNCELRQNVFNLSDLGLPTTFRSILKVVDLDLGSLIKKGARKESFYLTAEASQGRPSFWEQRGGRVYFDTSIDDEINLKFEILTVPPLVTLDGEFFVSEPFEAAIIAYVNWRASERSQEIDKAYSMKRNFEDLMKTLATETASDYLRDDNYGLRILQDEEEI